MAHEPRVLVIGFDPSRLPGPRDTALLAGTGPLAEAIANGLARFADAGIGFENCAIGLDGQDDTDAITEALVRRPWEVVLIGGGVRRADDHIEVFENIVNLVRQHAPGAAIAFNVTPVDIFDAAARWLKPSA